jgi:hypothetical protein
MRKVVLTLTFLIGLYALVRNNVGKLCGQIIWIGNPDIFYKEFIPFLMIVSAAFALFLEARNNIFVLSMFIVLVDAINRLSITINRFYGYIVYDIDPFIEKVVVGNELSKVNSFWPVYIIFGIEVIILILFSKSSTGLVLKPECRS